MNMNDIGIATLIIGICLILSSVQRRRTTRDKVLSVVGFIMIVASLVLGLTSSTREASSRPDDPNMIEAAKNADPHK